MIESACVSVSGVPWEPVTFTVKLGAPAVVGVPLMTPVDEASERPAGSEPESIVHVYGVVPPVATTVSL